jgi:hypothetical protein
MPAHRLPVLDRLLVSREIDLATGCWSWAGCCIPKGYGQISVNNIKVLVHRVAYEEFIGPIPDDLWVLHTCDNRKCFNPEHLFLGTCVDNVEDMDAKGRRGLSLGESHGLTTLTNAQALAVCADDRSQRTIASDYGVSQSTVSRIKNHHAWSHITLSEHGPKEN